MKRIETPISTLRRNLTGVARAQVQAQENALLAPYLLARLRRQVAIRHMVAKLPPEQRKMALVPVLEVASRLTPQQRYRYLVGLLTL